MSGFTIIIICIICAFVILSLKLTITVNFPKPPKDKKIEPLVLPLFSESTAVGIVKEIEKKMNEIIKVLNNK